MNLYKTEQFNILKKLLRIETTIEHCHQLIDLPNEDIKVTYSDDKERYLEMAMRFDSSDPDIRLRKKNIKSSANVANVVSFD